MSEEDQSHTQVLLPSAQVTLFTTDAKTKKAFETLEGDWRYARVVLDVQEGSVDEAIAYYETYESPDLVIIQTDNIDDGLSDKLEALAGSCSEGTAAIVIGPVNDVNLYRKLIGMGISDYLVKPISAEQFGDNIAETLIEKFGATGSRLIAFVGSKGGVGVTNLCQGLAWGFVDKLKQKTFLMDAACGWSTLSVGCDFEPSTTLGEAVRAAVSQSEDSLSLMISQVSERFFVLASGGDVMLDHTVEAEGYEELLDYMMVRYPVVIVDLSASTSPLKQIVLARAHEIILVSTPVLSAVRATRTLMQEIKELRGGSLDDIDLLINMRGFAPKEEVPKAQIEEALEKEVSVEIPFDPTLFVKVESQADKLGEAKGGGKIVDDLLMLAKKVVTIAGEATADPVDKDKKEGLGTFLNKMMSKS